MGHQPLDAFAEPAILRIEVFLERAAQLRRDELLVLLERLLHVLHQPVALALDQVGRGLTADVPQGEHADLESFQGVFVSLAAFRVLAECGR